MHGLSEFKCSFGFAVGMREAARLPLASLSELLGCWVFVCEAFVLHVLDDELHLNLICLWVEILIFSLPQSTQRIFPPHLAQHSQASA